MGHAARLNPRSSDGGKPRSSTALHRIWRAVQFFEHREAFEAWLSRFDLTPAQKAHLDRLWEEQHPAT